MEVYTLLTIGDGLVAQLPSLLLSIGTAIVVTRQNESHNMGEQFKAQLGNEKSLFIASGLNGWAVFLALILAGVFIMWLVNLSGKPSVQHGIPYPVFARVSMGVFGANFPAMARGLVAMFWYGAQTYAASTAVALLITGLTGIEGEPVLLGMTGVMWVSFIFVSFRSGEIFNKKRK